MSYLSAFKISVSPSVDCSYVYVNDVSTYPVGGSARTEVGIAIFWSVDDFSNVAGMNIVNNYDWYFDTINGSTYTIHAFMVPIWDSGETYDGTTNGMIVWHEGYFYMQTNSGPTGEPGAYGGSGWDLLAVGETNPLPAGGTLDEDSLYTAFKTRLIDDVFNLGYTEAFTEIDCAAFTVTKTACYEHTITNVNSYTVTEVKLYKYTGELLDDELVFSSGAISIDLEDYDGGDDGVFIVEITYSLSGARKIAQVPIFEFCGLQECYKAAFKYIQCKCTDPCDSDCLEQEGVEQRRNDAVLLFGLYHQILNQIQIDRLQYAGVMFIDDDRNDYISEVGRNIEKAAEIVARCGLCTDDDTNTVTC